MKETLFLATIIGLIFLAECQRTRPSRQGARCETPDGESGDCYNIRQCPRLLDLLRSSRNKPEVVDFLRRSVCGFDNSDPRVCCPNTASDQPAVTTTPRPTRISNEDGNSGNGGREESNDIFPRLLSPPNCGFSNFSHSRIQGGIPSVLGAWPWMTALGYRGRGKTEVKYLCGGALVSNKHVITAAHCTKHPSLALYVARLGDLDLDESVNDGASPANYVIRSALAHPGYDARKRVNDIAILYLKDTVTFNRLIWPICLPKMDRGKSFEQTYPFVAGWGSVRYQGPSSTQLLQVQIPVVPNTECRSAYAKLGADITSREICAGMKSGGKDACLGDSGGPLMVPIQSNFYLIGVVSYGYRCGEPGTPGIYSRTTEYIDWIDRNLI